jgi:hypothetical protein
LRRGCRILRRKHQSRDWVNSARRTTIFALDSRLKKDAAGITDGLDKLMKLRPVPYHWKDSAGYGKPVTAKSSAESFQ